jgi:23S rRNA pseudouridine2605 synthase
LFLNHYLAQAGICSRRKAVALIKEGLVSINNAIITTPTYQVKPTDVVRYKKRVIKPDPYIYVLVNKPAGYVSTTADEMGRNTVLDLVPLAQKKRLYPIGRLDKETTGLIVLTNDGSLAQKLSHPTFEIQKVYQATLDQPCLPDHIQKIKKGIRLKDGIARVDSVNIPNLKNRQIVRIALHSGKKHIIRRIFEALDLKVKKLDRINYAGLTQKDLKPGAWRYLKEDEVENLKSLSK